MCDRRVLEALGHDSLVDLALRALERVDLLTEELEETRRQGIWLEQQLHPPLGVSQAQVDQAHWHGIHRVPSMEEAARGAQRLAKAGPSVAQVEARLGMTPQRNNAATPEQYPNHPDAPHSAEQERTHD